MSVSARPVIDLNSDLGESFGNYVFGDDAAVMASVSSANVACGFHGGDPRGIRETCRTAVAAGVTIGAHPGYRDLAGFGRRFIDVDPGELADEIVYQVAALQGIARSVGGEVRYVKPHGGLYNTIAVDETQAGAVVHGLLDIAPELPLMALPGSVIERVAREAGLDTVSEAFADRGYAPDGTLVKRGGPGALLAPDAAVEQAIRLVREGSVTAVDGTVVEVSPDSICLHGDNPAAVELAARIRAGLEAAGIEIRSFA